MKDSNLIQRWMLLLTITIMSVELFDTNDYQFWLIAIGLGIALAPLHSNRE